MKYLVGVRTDVPLNEEDYGDTWIYMPDGDGNPEVAYLIEPPPETIRNTATIVQLVYYDQ